MKYYEISQNVTQKQEVSTCYGKNGADRLAQHSIATNLHFLKNVLSVMCKKLRTIKQSMPVTNRIFILFLLFSYFFKTIFFSGF